MIRPEVCEPRSYVNKHFSGNPSVYWGPQGQYTSYSCDYPFHHFHQRSIGVTCLWQGVVAMAPSGAISRHGCSSDGSVIIPLHTHVHTLKGVLGKTHRLSEQLQNSKSCIAPSNYKGPTGSKAVGRWVEWHSKRSQYICKKNGHSGRYHFTKGTRKIKTCQNDLLGL